MRKRAACFALLAAIVFSGAAFGEGNELFGSLGALLSELAAPSSPPETGEDGSCSMVFSAFSRAKYEAFLGFFLSNGFEISAFSGNDRFIQGVFTYEGKEAIFEYDPNALSARIVFPGSLLQNTFHRPVAEGDPVSFGSYEQDAVIENGEERIEWLVLDTDGDSALLISKYVLDAHVYGEETEVQRAPCTWDTSLMRVWLNGEFLESAFGEGERQRLVLSLVPADANPYYDTEQGADTYDFVWLISSKEMNAYFPEKAARIAPATDYLFSMHFATYRDNAVYSLRTAGNTVYTHAMTSLEGSIYTVSSNWLECAVRPMIRVKLN